MIRIVFDADALARVAAQRVVEAGVAAVAARGDFRLALSGGTTPEQLYRLLAGPEFCGHLDWGRVLFCFADERGVSPGHPDSNFRLVRETLLDPASIPADRVRRMRGEAEDLDAAAREYEAVLTEPLDLLLLGVGPDGHIASLFPGSPLVTEHRRRVAAVLDAPKPPSRRLTVTPRVLEETREVLVLASGVAKAEGVARALESDSAPGEVPARLVADRDWYLDRDAAGLLVAH